MAPTTSKYTAVRCVHHNQACYGPGQSAGHELDLTDEQAQPLVDVGAVVQQAASAEIGARTQTEAEAKAEAPAQAKAPAAKKR